MRRVILFLAAGLTAALLGCGGSVGGAGTSSSGGGSSNRTAAEPQGYRVVYTVTSDVPHARADVTFNNADGGTDSLRDTSIEAGDSFRQTLQMEAGDHAYVSAQLSNGSRLTCRLTINGVLVDEATSRGGHAIATCSSIVGR